MALGGGTFLVQNKKLPGTYMNFVSVARASATLSDRGYGALPLMLDWGVDGEVFTVDTADMQKDSLTLFGYDYAHAKLRPVREFFRYARVGYFYRLNSGQKAQNDLAVAKYSGVRGNDLTVAVQVNIDEPTLFDVITVLEGNVRDTQTVENMEGLADNAFLVWKRSAALAATAGMPLAGGSNAAAVTGTQHQEFLDKVESYSFNTLGCPSSTPTIADLYIAFTRRMRDEVGVKFQTVVWNRPGDYEGIININPKNRVLDPDEEPAALVYWMTGTSAGCAVNRSNTNRIYNGEYTIAVDLKQRDLEAAIDGGLLTFHRVGDDVRVLEDISSFVTVTVDKNDDFKMNQVIRVLDQIGNDVAVVFNTKYLGQYPNDAAGRISLWDDLVKLHRDLQTLRAIQDFVPEDITVEQGETQKAVAVTDYVTPTVAMTQLYMTVWVR